MNKRELVKYVEILSYRAQDLCRKEEAEGVEKLIVEFSKSLEADKELKEVKRLINLAISNVKTLEKKTKVPTIRWKSSLADVLGRVTENVNSPIEYVKFYHSTEKIPGYSEFIKEQYTRRELVKENYNILLRNVKACASAVDGIEYLRSLGIVVNDKKTEEKPVMLITPLDTSFIVYKGDTEKNK